MIPIGVYTTFCQEEGILLQKYRDRNGRCVATLFRNIGVRVGLTLPNFLHPNPSNKSTPSKKMQCQKVLLGPIGRVFW